MDNKDTELMYICCPHCHRGWFAQILDIGTEDINGVQQRLTHFTVSGINPTDLMKPIKCLSCGEIFQPINGGIMDFVHGWTRIEYNTECNLAMTDNWVADRVMNTKGS